MKLMNQRFQNNNMIAILKQDLTIVSEEIEKLGRDRCQSQTELAYDFSYYFVRYINITMNNIKLLMS